MKPRVSLDGQKPKKLTVQDSRQRTLMPPQRVVREAIIHTRSVRLIFNISEEVLRCNWSSMEWNHPLRMC